MAGAAAEQVFTGLVFVVEPIAGTESKASEVKKTIAGNGGVVSRIVTEETSFVIICDSTKIDHASPRLDKARLYNVPVLGAEYVQVCAKIGRLLPHDDFTIIVKTVMAEEFQKGLPPDKQKETVADPSRIKVWKWGDPHSPSFPTGEELSDPNGSYELVKSILLQKSNGNNANYFCVLEIHARCQDYMSSHSQQEATQEMQTYRIFMHHGNALDVKDTNSGQKECRFTTVGREAEHVYTYLYKKYTSDGYTRTTTMLSRWIGSPVYRKKTLQSASHQMVLQDEVAYLVDYVWREAMGTLAAILSVPVRSFTLEKVEKAESILLEMRCAIDNQEDTIESIAQRFYTIIPHKESPTHNLNKKFIARKQDICQLIKDIVNVNESTGWSQSSDEVSKYQALNCVIHCLSKQNTERQHVQHIITSTQKDEEPLTIHNVYAVSRSVEEAAYNHNVGNNKLMFHCSRPANFLGILSRGLLLPKIVVSELGIGRRDAGMLGSGLYFGDQFSTAMLYSSPSEMTGTRLMVVARVALGNTKEIFKHDLTLEKPPEGYNSTHGVCKGPQITSDFTEDEFVVYASDQQCIQYVVEFTLPDDTKESFTRTVSVDEADYYNPTIEKLITKIDVADVQCAPNPVAMVQPGLVAKDCNQQMVELQAVHVRAKIQDLAAQVVVFQSYKNNSSNPIEGKYVFPLDDQAAVCGFEAFINNKHIIGLLKEKEEAKQEYKQAVAAGHGAYLMHEEAHNVFSVSIGNLPPQAQVLIKITYVTELSIEGSTLAFTLLGSVAPWKQQEIQTRGEGDKAAYHIDAVQSRDESLQLSLHMASDIRCIASPTHTIKTKYKDSCGSVILSGDTRLGDSFQLLIGLAEIHTPRLWVEKHTDSSSQAAMLVFYPDFITDMIKDPEIIIMLDMSNSMQGTNLQEATTLTQIILKQLPAACTFNVVIFGTEYEELFPSSQVKSKSCLDEALGFIQTAKADRGSTEAWNPLHAFSLLQSSNTSPRNIFLVTDGHVTNEEATIAAISQNRQNCRIFTFSVSSTANHHALCAMSRLGGGASESFNIKAKSTWEKKVRQQVIRCCQPAVTNIRVEWLDMQNTTQAPALITTVFSGSRLVVYALTDTCEQVVLKADIPTGPYGSKEHTTVFASEDRKTTQGKVIHQLAARSIVRDWEDGALHADRIHHGARKNELQADIIELSKKFSIITPLTSFIAVEERTEREDPSPPQEISIVDLVAKENMIDSIPSVDWKETIPQLEASPERQVMNLVHTAKIASETFSFDAAERYYEEAYKLAEDKLSTQSTLILEVAEALSKFYCIVRRQAQKAYSVIDNVYKKQQDMHVKPVTDSAENLQQLDQLDKVAEWAQLCKSLDESFEPADIGSSIEVDDRPPSPDIELDSEDDEDDYIELQQSVKERHSIQKLDVIDDDIPIQLVSASSTPSTKIATVDIETIAPTMDFAESTEWLEIVEPTMEVEQEPDQMMEEIYVSLDSVACRERSPELVLERSVRLEPVECREEIIQEPVRVMAARAESPVQLVAYREPSPELVLERSVRLDPVEYRQEIIQEPVRVMAYREPSPELVLERSVRLEPVEYREEIIQEPVRVMAYREPSPELVLERSVRLDPVEYREEIIQEPVRVMAARAESPVQLVAYREPSPELVLERRRAVSPVQLVAVQLADREPSPELDIVVEYLDSVTCPEPSPEFVLERSVRLEPVEYLEEITEEPLWDVSTRAESPVPKVGYREPSPELERLERVKPMPMIQKAARAESPIPVAVILPLSPPSPPGKAASTQQRAPPPPGLAPGLPPPPPLAGASPSFQQGFAGHPIAKRLPSPGEPPSDRMPSIDGALSSEEDDVGEWKPTLQAEMVKTSSRAVKPKSKGFGFSMPARFQAKTVEIKKRAKTVDVKKKARQEPKIPVVPSARKHQAMVYPTSIERLISLQDQGSWHFSSSFDSILGIDSDVCIEVIDHILNRLQPAGVSQQRQSVLSLLATVLAVLHLRLYLSKRHEESDAKTSLCNKIQASIEAALVVIHEQISVAEKAGLDDDWWNLGDQLLQNPW